MRVTLVATNRWRDETEAQIAAHLKRDPFYPTAQRLDTTFIRTTGQQDKHDNLNINKDLKDAKLRARTYLDSPGGPTFFEHKHKALERGDVHASTDLTGDAPTWSESAGAANPTALGLMLERPWEFALSSKENLRVHPGQAGNDERQFLYFTGMATDAERPA